MWQSRTMVLVLLVGALGGCAGQGGRPDVARLQSQVGLLDERVTQLERASLSGAPLAGASAGEAGVDTSPLMKEVAKPEPVSSGAAETASSSSKPSTREVQQALKNAGFYQGSVDGKMGPKTRDAVKEFQRVHGLMDDGVVGRNTWSKLRSYSSLSGAGSDLSAAEPLK